MPRENIISRSNPPHESVLQACEVAMTVALAKANAARAAKDTAQEAHWLARLAWWTQQATDRLQEAA